MYEKLPTVKEREHNVNMFGDSVIRLYDLLDGLSHDVIKKVRQESFNSMGGTTAAESRAFLSAIGITDLSIGGLYRLSLLTYDYLTPGEKATDYREAIYKLQTCR